MGTRRIAAERHRELRDLLAMQLSRAEDAQDVAAADELRVRIAELDALIAEAPTAPAIAG